MSEKTETSSNVRDVAEKSIEQARSAIGSLLEVARTTAETIQTTAKTSERPEGVAVTRGFGFARDNISAIFDYAQQLVRAPDLSAAAKIHADFVQEQAATMQKQVEELRGLKPAEGGKD